MSATEGAAPSVPGYRTGRLLAFGATGEVWSAVSEGGERVALKVLRVDAADERVRREIGALREVSHPHVIRLREVGVVDGTGVALVLDRALGGSLSALVATRGPLDVGEVVTVLTPLAAALADLHDRGVVHGDVAPSNVLFDDSGRPLLADLGLATLVGAPADGAVFGTPGYADPARLGGAPASPQADVFGLAAVAWFALTGRAPGPAAERPPLVTVVPEVPVSLAVLLDEALDADPGRRPAARELAGRSFECAPAEPVRLVPTDPAAAPAEVVTHRLRAAARAEPDTGAEAAPGRVVVPRRLVAAAVAGAVAVVAAAWLVPPLLRDAPAASPRQEEPVQPVAGTPPVSQVPSAVEAALAGENPLAAVPALAWLRARGLGTGEAALLERANAPGGPALEADMDRLVALREAGVVLDGLGFDVRETVLVSADGDKAVVDAAVVTAAHRRVDGQGEVVQVVPEGEQRVSRLVLRRGEEGWQVERVG